MRGLNDSAEELIVRVERSLRWAETGESTQEIDGSQFGSSLPSALRTGDC